MCNCSLSSYTLIIQKSNSTIQIVCRLTLLFALNLEYIIGGYGFNLNFSYAQKNNIKKQRCLRILNNIFLLVDE